MAEALPARSTKDNVPWARAIGLHSFSESENKNGAMLEKSE